MLSEWFVDWLSQVHFATPNCEVAIVHFEPDGPRRWTR
jgi:hypothetical protein